MANQPITFRDPRSTALTGIALIWALSLPGLAHAQDVAGPPPDIAQEQDVGLNEIVVTAQKRSESLQRTALSISAANAETIEDRAISTAADLGAIAPNLTTTQGPSASSHVIVHIRGIGESEPILTADAPVSVYVDGVVLGRASGSLFDVVDLERIEVLRGPQGTLYGRNTTGGAVNLIVKKSADEMGGYFFGSVGNFGLLQGRVSLDTGFIADTGLKAKFTYLHKQRDGYVDDLNAPDSRDPGALNVEAFRIALSYDRSGPFRADYSFDYGVNDSTAPQNQLAAMRPNQLAYFSRSPLVGGTGFIGPSLQRVGTVRSEGTFIFDRNQAHALTLELDLGSDTLLRSITGYRSWQSRTLNTDLDGNAGLRGLVVSPAPPGIKPITLFGADKIARQHQWSQELNLIGSIGDRLNYVLGGFYFSERARETNPQSFTFVTSIPGLGLAGVNLSSLLAYRTRNESAAIFGQATYKITDRLSFTGGLRYTRDEKELRQSAPLVRVLKRESRKLNFAATMQYQATDDLMVFGRVATGYKAGGFNARSVNEGYDPESVTNYEVGAKSEWFDRRLRLNWTLFYATLKDKQLSQFVAGSGGAASVTVNAGSADFKGIELEFEAVPFEKLQLSGSFGYVDGDFKTFEVLDPATNQIIDVSDEARFSYSAKTTYRLGAQYSFGDLFGGSLSARLDYSYRSKIHFNVVPRFAPFDEQIASGSVGLLDGRVMLTDLSIGPNKGQIALWGKNLTNRKYRVSGIDFGSLGFATNTYSLPRTYGIDLKLEF